MIRWSYAALVLLPLLALCAGAMLLAPARKNVSIKDMKFAPASIDVAVGDSVRWKNEDQRDHTVTATDGSFKSGNLRSGGTFEHRFDTAGKFNYSCSYHPRMKGTVNVSE